MKLYSYITLYYEPMLSGLLIGIVLTILIIWLLLRKILPEVTNKKNTRTVATDWLKKKQLKRGPTLVAIGGGTGLSTILGGLKKYSSNLTAIVTVSDDGGSSGRLRKDLQILPPGDIRNCLISLANQDELLSQLLQYRFTKGEALSGHSFGNLLLAALTDIRGGFLEAVKSASEVLAISGEVLPSTCKNVALKATLKDGTTITGETNISKTKVSIKTIELIPQSPLPAEKVIEKIQNADAIILGPGSLYTSIIPNLLVQGICKAINNSTSPVIYIANMMTQPGETDNFTLENHVEALLSTTSLKRLDYILANNSEIETDRIKQYEEHGSLKIEPLQKLSHLCKTTVINAPLLCKKGLIRHSPEKTAEEIIKLTLNKTIN